MRVLTLPYLSGTSTVLVDSRLQLQVVICAAYLRASAVGEIYTSKIQPRKATGCDVMNQKVITRISRQKHAFLAGGISYVTIQNQEGASLFKWNIEVLYWGRGVGLTIDDLNHSTSPLLQQCLCREYPYINGLGA